MLPELCVGVALGFNLGTYHFKNQETHNNVNPGVYAVCKRPNGAGITVGTYENSNWRRSWHAGVTYELLESGDHSLSITVGAVTGYPQRRITPVVLPSYGYKLWDGFGLRAAFIPPLGEKIDGGVHVSIEKSF